MPAHAGNLFPGQVDELIGRKCGGKITGLIVRHHGTGERHLVLRAGGACRRDMERRFAGPHIGQSEFTGREVVGASFGQQSLRARGDRKITVGRDLAGGAVDLDLVGEQQRGAILDARMTLEHGDPGADVEGSVVRKRHRGRREHLGGDRAAGEQD